jgi:hypothetical protein
MLQSCADDMTDYWTTCLLLFATSRVLHQKIADAYQYVELTYMTSWVTLPELPSWMNPRPMATNISLCAAHYFEDDAGYWGAAAACFSVGALSHFCAARGLQQSPEMESVQHVFMDKKLGGLTKHFLRSMANTPNTLKGDTLQKDQYKRMANSW